MYTDALGLQIQARRGDKLDFGRMNFAQDSGFWEPKNLWNKLDFHRLNIAVDMNFGNRSSVLTIPRSWLHPGGSFVGS